MIPNMLCWGWALSLVVLSIVTGDCSNLIPPCWQELHYLIGGVLVGFLFALPFWEGVRRYYL